MINQPAAPDVISPHAKVAMWHFVVVTLIGALISTGIPALLNLMTTAQLAAPATSAYGLVLSLGIALVSAFLVFLQQHRQQVADDLATLADYQAGMASLAQAPAATGADPLATALGLAPDASQRVQPVVAAIPSTTPTTGPTNG